MKFKVAVTDYDGTLLRSDDTVSEYTLNVIEEFRRRGGLFLIATGRMYSGILSQMKKLRLDKFNLPLISYQGAYVRNSIDGKVLYDERLAFEQAVSVAEYAEEKGFYCHTYIDDILYVNDGSGFTLQYADALKVGFTPVGRISDFLKKTGKGAHKVLVAVEKQYRADTAREMKERFGAEMLIQSPSSFMVDAISLKAGKDRAIEEVITDLGYTLKDCITFGDNYNDYDMIQRAGCGVAIGNAVQDVKDMADIVAETNDNDGVAKAIEKFCF